MSQLKPIGPHLQWNERFTSADYLMVVINIMLAGRVRSDVNRVDWDEEGRTGRWQGRVSVLCPEREQV